MKEEKTPQQQAIENTKANLKKFLASAERRDGGKFTVDNIDTDANGQPVTLSGTVTVPIPDAKTPTTNPMTWNILGKSLSQNIGLDLVVKIAAKDFLK